MAEEHDFPEVPSLSILSQYVKDFSFENLDPFASMMDKPIVSIMLDAGAQHMDDSLFEVVLQVEVDAKHKDSPVFLLNLDYAGVFKISEEVPEEYLRPLLMVECPRLLFPFARSLVATMTQEVGIPILLSHVDFAALYQRQLAEEQEVA